MLTTVLTYHVVPGRLTEADIDAKIKEGGGKLLSPGLSLPDLPRSVCVAVTNAARPWRASWSAVIFVIAGLPGRQPRGDLAQQGSHHVANCSRCFGIGAA